MDDRAKEIQAHHGCLNPVAGWYLNQYGCTRFILPLTYMREESNLHAQRLQGYSLLGTPPAQLMLGDPNGIRTRDFHRDRVVL